MKIFNCLNKDLKSKGMIGSHKQKLFKAGLIECLSRLTDENLFQNQLIVNNVYKFEVYFKYELNNSISFYNFSITKEAKIDE